MLEGLDPAGLEDGSKDERDVPEEYRQLMGFSDGPDGGSSARMLKSFLDIFFEDIPTVYHNARASRYSRPAAGYIAGGTAAATLTGVRGVSDAFSRHDAVDGHRQSPSERILDGASGTVQLVATGVAVSSPIRARIATGTAGIAAASSNAPTIGDIVASQSATVSDDALVNFGQTARSTVNPPTGRSYWFRYGDIKHLTPRQIQTVVGDLAHAGESDGFRFMRVAKESTGFVKRPPANGASIPEYISDNPTDVASSVPVVD
ncbi:MAG: hypothetical protein D6800_03710 [Candidatus Zixiibacteriota bacterium]|nr:MAG: hypothetical protein D6800_03710 [candidate division Zixibacteria bacterium]